MAQLLGPALGLGKEAVALLLLLEQAEAAPEGV